MSKHEHDEQRLAGARGAKVREGIGKTLTNDRVVAEARAEQEGKEPDAVEQAAPSSRTAAGVEEHVGMIERRVGELIGDPKLAEEGRAREAEGSARRTKP